MAKVLNKIRTALQRTFPPPDRIDLRDEDGIIGVVVSSKFKNMDSMDRIDMVWDVLDKHLSTDEKKQIVIMIAVTPQEEIAHTS